MMMQLAILFFLSVGTWQDEVKQIDQQIENLQDLQGKLRSDAKKKANKAMRWQFQNENYSDARRAWDQVAAAKQKVQELQDQIDDLESKKQKILKEHGEKSP